jgi:hypothetical protein
MKTKRLLLWALTLCCCLLLPARYRAQTGNPYWTLVPGYVNTNPPVAYTSLPTQSPPGYNGWTQAGDKWGDPVQGPHNAYFDPSGNLLFSVVSGFVFSPRGFLVDTLIDTVRVNRGGPDTLVRQVACGWAETCVVPVPDSCSQYYIFSATDYGSSASSAFKTCYETAPNYTLAVAFKPCYAIIDVKKQAPSPAPAGEMGKIIKPTGSVHGRKVVDLFSSTGTHRSDTIDNCSPYAGDVHFAATKLLNGSYRFVFVKTYDEIFVYKITSTGITWQASVDLSNYNFWTDLDDYNNDVLSELEVHDDSINSRIKVACTVASSSWGHRLILGDFNRSTGAVNSSTLKAVTFSGGNSNLDKLTGIEFSPDGNTVFITRVRTTQDTSTVQAINYATPTTITKLSYNADFSKSQIELAQDGNLYLIGTTGPRFAQIQSPNSSPSFHDNYLSISYSQGSPQNYVRTGGGQIFYVWYLPDQIDQEVYGPQFGKAACCQIYSVYDKKAYTSGQNGWSATNQVWKPNTVGTTYNPLIAPGNTSSTATIESELRIARGYTVTIQNMTIKFSPQATLIVEGYTGGSNPGELILKKCTLDVDTRCQSTLWPGVRVWGDSIYSRTNVTKGYIYIDSMSVITNAWVGVELGYDSKYAATYGAKPADTVHCGGGNIFCQNSSFINNQRDVVFDRCQYTTGGTSSIYTSTLTTTASLLGGASPTKHIQFKDYKINALLKGLTITCGSGLSYFIQDTGIYAYNSNFNLDENNTPLVWNSISNMYNGIYATNSGGTTTFTAKHTVFANNVVGENIEAVNNSITENDTFKIYNRPSRFGTPTNCSGIFMDNSTGYYVQDNYLTRNSTGYSNLYGVVSNNSGPYANAIFRNRFNNLYKGSQAQYRNYVATGQIRNGTGLLYLCNIFDNGTITAGDIYVPATGSSTNVGGSHTDTAGVGNAQGNPSPGGGNRYTADNQFSHTSGGQDFYIENGKAFASNYEYYASAGNCGVASVWLPSTINRLVPACTTLASAPDCSTGGTGHRTADALTTALNQAASSKVTYDSLMNLFDGGSTSDLISLVKGNNSANGVRSTLSSVAPYLSNAVLINYINSQYPANDIYSVLAACSPLTQKVNDALAASNLSAGLKSQLASLQNGPSPMDNLDQSISGAFTSRHLALNEAIRILIHSHTDSADIQANALMKERAFELPARVQVTTGIDIHDSVMAAQALSKVAAEEGQSNFVKLHTILLNNLNKTAEQIMASPANLSTISAMDNDSTDHYTFLKANILLHAVGLSNYQPYYQDNDTTQAVNEFKSNSPKAANSMETGNLLYSQPNPFKDNTTIKATISQKTDNAYVLVSDMLGKEVARYKVQQGENEILFTSSEINQQIFFCTLVIDGVKIKTNKMVLIK